MISAKYIDLIVEVVLIAVPLIAVMLEKPEKRLGRKEFFFCVLSAICLLALLGFLADGLSGPISGVIFISFLLVLLFALYRAIVRRSVDAGFGKWPAYVAVIPWLNYVCVLILLFLPSKSDDQPDAPPLEDSGRQV